MFKKNVWVIALIAAVAFAVMIGGCIEPAEDEGGVETDVVKLSEVIANAPLGVIATDDDWNAIFKDSPFARCGSPTFEIIKEGGVNKLKIWKMNETWGQGIDIRSASTKDNKGAGFKKGDEIQVKGTASPGGIILNSKGEGFAKIANWASGGTFDEKFTLTADDAGNAKNQTKGIRLQYDSDVPKRQGVIILEEFYVKGKRGAGDSDDADYSIPGSGSYKVPAIPAADTGKYYYLNLNAAVKGQATGDKFVGSFSEAKIEETELTVGFKKKDLYVFVPFDDDLKPIIVDRLKNYYTLDVVIEGSGTALVEWCFGEDGKFDDGADITEKSNNKAFNTQLTSNQSLKVGRSVEKLEGFLLRSSDSKSSNYNTPQTIVIKSIKITPKAASKPIPTTDPGLVIGITKPVAGNEATKEPVDIKHGTDLVAKGAIKWSPGIPSSDNWTTADYLAIITITPEADYYIPLSISDGLKDTDVYRVVGYNPTAKEVSITFK